MNSGLSSLIILDLMLYHSISTGRFHSNRLVKVFAKSISPYPQRLDEVVPGEKKWDTCAGLYVVYSGYLLHIDSHWLLDNEFTQLMKGLQGERLRQAFKFLDSDQDGFIRPEEFKRIILVCVQFGFECQRAC